MTMNNDYVCVGKIVNTHGIKGELRILSDFELKNKVFKKDINLYVGSEKRKFTITTYRHHKMFDMVTFKGITNINEVLSLKGLLVYVKRETLNLDNDYYILSDLIGLDVYDKDKKIGTVKDYYLDNGNTLLDVLGKKEFYIPLKSHYIKRVNLQDKKIITEGGSELIL